MSLREYIERRSLPIPFAGCWLWLQSFGSHGYGNASTPRERVTTAHRVSYEAFKGPIPIGMLVQHSCDNRWCVNPDHLSLGTDATNAIDKQIKGRAAKRLNVELVREIKRLYAEGATIRRLARMFNVSQRAIQAVTCGRAWRHVGANGLINLKDAA